MVRTASYDRNGVKKGVWSPEEDDKLKAYIQRYGHWNWLKLPSFAGLSRTGKSCRLRWMNYLRPNVIRGNYTKEEDELIIKLQEQLGNKWCVIASKLPGRTDNEIKNHWHTKLKKKPVKRNTTAYEETEKDQCIEPNTLFVDYNILESSQMSLEPYSSSKEPSGSFEEHELSSGVNLAAVDSVAKSTAIFSGLSGDFWTEPYFADNYQFDDFPSTLAEDEIFHMARIWWIHSAL